MHSIYATFTRCIGFVKPGGASKKMRRVNEPLASGRDVDSCVDCVAYAEHDVERV